MSHFYCSILSNTFKYFQILSNTLEHIFSITFKGTFMVIHLLNCIQLELSLNSLIVTICIHDYLTSWFEIVEKVRLAQLFSTKKMCG